MKKQKSFLRRVKWLLSVSIICIILMIISLIRMSALLPGVSKEADKQKEEVLEEFAQKGNLLLATTVVEVGISLPKLSTIIIVAPERLGLATLHQLRGRVSRNGLKGYSF